ncbi:MAG: hypothetical protein ACYCZO_14965, partial [Daejeonella sp.]
WVRVLPGLPIHRLRFGNSSTQAETRRNAVAHPPANKQSGSGTAQNFYRRATEEYTKPSGICLEAGTNLFGSRAEQRPKPGRSQTGASPKKGVCFSEELSSETAFFVRFPVQIVCFLEEAIITVMKNCPESYLNCVFQSLYFIDLK